MTALAAMRRVALAAITALVAAATLVSFAESYRALYEWAARHGLEGVWATVWPLQVDVFIAVGELALFVALADGWAWRSRAAAWTVTTLGLAVSVAGNVGHVASADWPSRATAAVPPIAAAAALAVGLGVLKRVVASTPEPVGVPAEIAEPEVAPANGYAAPERGREAAEVFAEDLGRGLVPSIRAIRSALHIGQPRAQQIRDYLAVLART
jgi:hypothetical protein